MAANIRCRVRRLPAKRNLRDLNKRNLEAQKKRDARINYRLSAVEVITTELVELLPLVGRRKVQTALKALRDHQRRNAKA